MQKGNTISLNYTYRHTDQCSEINTSELETCESEIFVQIESRIELAAMIRI